MEASSLLTSSTYSPYPSSTPPSPHFKKPHFFLNSNSVGKCRILNINPQTTRFPLSLPATSLLRTSAVAVAGEFMEEKSTEHSDSSSASKHTLLPKIDKSGRFCSPRAARELALYVQFIIIIIIISKLWYSWEFSLFIHRNYGLVEWIFEIVRSIIYAACLEGSDPVRLFEKRMNVRRG